jgi:hypothetical protein
MKNIVDKNGDNLADKVRNLTVNEIAKYMDMAGAVVVRVFIIDRSDVENLNLAPYLSPLMAILKDRDAVIRRRQNVNVCFEGYNSDPRELYQIPEVRTFFSILDQQFPYWFYFINPASVFFEILMPCLCPLEEVSDSMDGKTKIVKVHRSDHMAYLTRHFSAMNHILDQYHLDDDDQTLNKQMTQQIIMASKLFHN